MFIPKKIIFLKDSLNYEIGTMVYDYFKDKKNTEIVIDNKNIIKSNFDHMSLESYYKDGKKTLVLGVKKITNFQSCKPSAHYQLPLTSGCFGQCEYCYLQTELAKRPYIKINVNIDEILSKALDYINTRSNQITIFEGSATADVLPLEPYTKILSKTIAFFANIENGRFRFVSKFNDVDNLLYLNHNKHTEARFSINTETVINEYEHKTPSIKKRITAAKKMLKADYPVGFLIAPVFLYDNYQAEYYELLKNLKNDIGDFEEHITFEIISHRFTSNAKKTILSVFPDTKLDMNEAARNYKKGQFGYGKYLYKKEDLINMKLFFSELMNVLFPKSRVLYII